MEGEIVPLEPQGLSHGNLNDGGNGSAYKPEARMSA